MQDNIINEWNEKGYVNIPNLFSQDEIKIIRKEGIRLLNERNPNWKQEGMEGSQPYKFPSHYSKIFADLMVDNRIVDYAKMLITNDIEGADEIQVSQTWMYFKPPGELGRDVHQNIFYTHCDWGGVLNVSLAIDESTEENGCLYFYPGSHKEKIAYPIPDDWKDEERMKTNPTEWRNERGKPIFIPGTYVNGEWVDKYPKEYLPCKPGSLTLIHSHVLHGSEENKTTDTWRMSFLCGYIAKGTYVLEGKDMNRQPIDV